MVRGPCGERVKCFLLVHSNLPNLQAICFEFALYLRITIEKPPINRLSSMTTKKTWPHIHVASAFSRISSIYGLLLAFSSRKRVFGFHARFFLKLNFSILLQPHRDRRTKKYFRMEQQQWFRMHTHGRGWLSKEILYCLSTPRQSESARIIVEICVGLGDPQSARKHRNEDRKSCIQWKPRGRVQWTFDCSITLTVFNSIT